MTGPEPLTDEEFSHLGKTMGMLFQRIMRARKDNPESGQISVLAVLAKCGPSRSSDLANEMMLDLSTVSRHVAHLESQGLVEKIADPRDRRATTLHLTPLGEKFVADFWQQRIDAMRDGLAHWAPEDLRTLARLFELFVEDYTAIFSKQNTQLKTGTDHE